MTTAKARSRVTAKSTSSQTRFTARGRLAAARELAASVVGVVLAGLRTGSPIEQHLTGHSCENGWWGIPWAIPRGPVPDYLLPYQTVRQQRGNARRFSKEELQELCRQLEPAYRAGFRLRVRCGYCPGKRLLDEIVIAHDLHHDSYSLTSNFRGSTTECGYSSGPWHSKMLVGPHRRGAETGMGDAHRPDRKVVGAQAPTRRSLARARHYCIQPPSGPSWYHRARGLVRAGADHRHGCVAPPPARLR